MKEKREENAKLLEQNNASYKKNVQADLSSLSPIGKFNEHEICNRFYRSQFKSESRGRKKENKDLTKVNMDNLNYQLLTQSNRVMEKWKTEKEDENVMQNILNSLTDDVRKQRQLENNYGERLIYFIEWLNEQPDKYLQKLRVPRIFNTVITGLKDYWQEANMLTFDQSEVRNSNLSSPKISQKQSSIYQSAKKSGSKKRKKSASSIKVSQIDTHSHASKFESRTTPDRLKKYKLQYDDSFMETAHKDDQIDVIKVLVNWF